MTKFKALSLIQSRDYVRDTYGPEGVARMKARLSRGAYDAVYSENLMATDWIELDHCIEHAVAIDELFGSGDGTMSAKVVRQITNKHFNDLYRSVLQTSTPRSMLERSGRLWNRYYDRGDSSVEFPTPTSAIKRIFNCPDLPAKHEYFVLPFYEEVLRLCGAED